MTTSPPRLFHNARILTLDPRNPVVSALLAVDGRVGWIGDGEPPETPQGVESVDCEGATVLPGFIDAHCHPLALGARLAAVDCSPSHVRSIAHLQRRLREAARPTSGFWIKAVGYDELLLAEGRHPTRADLDAAVPDRPVRLVHAAGHALVLNSKGLEAVGIDATTAEPPGGTIDREPESGEPTGLLFEMSGYVGARMPRPEDDELNRYARGANEALISAGVTSVTDAGHTNRRDRVELYGRLQERGTFRPRATVMLAPDADRAGLPSDGPVRAGAAKLMLTMSGGRLSRSVAELGSAIQGAVDGDVFGGALGVAIHAVEEEAVLAACEALSRLDEPALMRRIEHASEAPPHVVSAIARAGATVVTQPGFLYERGERYLAAAADGGPDPSCLYPLRLLLEAGVNVAAGSDAPYGPHRPLDSIAAAVSRRSRDGKAVGPEQSVTIDQALRMFGPAAAAAEGFDRERGTLTPGKVADFVVLDRDPLRLEPDAIAGIQVLQTVIGGENVWPPAQAG